jgi:hypothetical protein
VAEAGKKEYNIPMYVNAWLQQPNHPWPGVYPSGGPVPQVHDVWRAGAPSIDILAPDLYVESFAEVCARFNRSGNPLFIPETGAGAEGAAKTLYAFGRHDAIGFSPFGVDGGRAPDDNLIGSYDLISQLTPLIVEHQGKGTMSAVLLNPNDPPQKVRLGNHTIEATFQFASHPGAPVARQVLPPAAALFIDAGARDRRAWHRGRRRFCEWPLGARAPTRRRRNHPGADRVALEQRNPARHSLSLPLT